MQIVNKSSDPMYFIKVTITFPCKAVKYDVRHRYVWGASLAKKSNIYDAERRSAISEKLEGLSDLVVIHDQVGSSAIQGNLFSIRRIMLIIYLMIIKSDSFSMH